MEREQQVEFLSTNAVFTELSRRAIGELLDLSTLRTISAGGHFIQQGDPAAIFHVLVQGRVKLLQVTPDGHQVLARYVGPGQEFGLVSLVGGYTYPRTVEAVDECAALAWSGEELAHSCARFPQLGLNALRIMVNRNQEMQRRYQELLTNRVEQRVAQALLRLVDQAGLPVENGTLIDIPLTRADLAEFTGTTLFSVSRILRRWQLDGLLDTSRKRIVLCDFPGLHEIADPLDGATAPAVLACGR